MSWDDVGQGKMKRGLDEKLVGFIQEVNFFLGSHCCNSVF